MTTNSCWQPFLELRNARYVKKRVLGPTPWVEQLAHDLEIYDAIIPMWGTKAGTLTQQIKDMGGTVLFRIEWRARIRVMSHDAVQTRHMTETRDSVPDGQALDVCGFTAANGEVCQYTGTKRTVAVHKATSHGQRNPIRELVRINECPLCETNTLLVSELQGPMYYGVCKLKYVTRKLARPSTRYVTNSTACAARNATWAIKNLISGNDM